MSETVQGGVDIFGLGANWEIQTDSDPTAYDRATATDSCGDIGPTAVFGANKVPTCTALYVGAEVSFNAALDADGCNPGQKPGAYVISTFAVDYAPTLAGQKPMCTFTGADGFAAASNIFKPLVTLPTYPGCVPDVIPNSDATGSEVTGLQYTLAVPFGTDKDAAGDIIRGNTYGGEETIQLTYYGVPTLDTTGYDTTQSNEDHSNQEFSTSGYTLMSQGMSRVTTTTTTV